MNPIKWTIGAFGLMLLVLLSETASHRYCSSNSSAEIVPPDTVSIDSDTLLAANVPHPLFTYKVPRDIPVKEYFPFIDSLVEAYDSVTPYDLSEHLLIRNNAWVIDTLADMDYYRRMDRGVFVYDQHQLVVLHKGDSLQVPDTIDATQLQNRINTTWIDINIPDFRLRIVEGSSDTLFSMKVRVGQNKKRFQAVINRVADLRTRPGKGQIARINRTPSLFEDPHTGRRYRVTRRDDGRVTKMPLIPWLEPEINGMRLGQMIHPTTNPASLGKAYSNGCVGCSESDAWYLYYYAPLGTKIIIRYDLTTITASGDTITLPDIYRWKNRKR